ncbi:LCP family protein required for cell wall assembly [Streptomyces zagrosensis]|uniref:LCP family protein required for cell wall assembly n=1 Tax=Streptomyces zagrosensis TaxID=1042984 RepID=A0A7W9QFB6_9ACTN|nr:LCP family protein required for cell wall assembly [Streptomyces zagrosensis]
MIGAATVLVAGGIGHAVVSGLHNGIERIDPFGALDHRPSAGDGTNYLVVGTDGREKITPAQKAKYRLGGEPCHCTDTLMLVHVSADHDRASVISLPRDSYAEIPAYTDTTGAVRRTHPQKLNAAYAEGGPSLTVRTVEHMTGVHIDHYLEVDFTSFMRTVDVVGGVEVCTVRPLKDRYSGLDLPAGRHTLQGGEALQYVRSRHIDGAADLGRMQRQQRFLAALIDKATNSGVLLNPVKFSKVASSLLGSVRADREFGSTQLVGLGEAMRNFSPASSEFTSVPVSDVSYPVAGVGSTVRWNEAQADQLFRAVRQDRPLTPHRTKRPRATTVEIDPAQIRVQVVNGTGRAGLGEKTDRALRATGFATTGTATTAATTGLPRTVIAHDPEWNRSARSLAAALPGAELRPTPGQGGTLQVTLGTDHQDVHRVRPERPAGADNGLTAVRGDQVNCS